MSRYTIPAQHPALTVTVGWDNPLRTLFAQVFDPTIEEDADAHAPVGGGNEAVDNERAGVVGMEDVVLEVERPVGELDQDGTRDEGVEPGRQKPEPGATSVRLAPRVDPTFKACQATKGCLWSGRPPERKM